MRQIFSFLIKNLIYAFAFKEVKKKGLLLYLKTLQTVRKSLLFVFVLFFSLQLMLVGFVGAIATGIWLLPIENPQTRLWILLASCLFLFLFPLFILVIAFSEKTWFKISGVEDQISS